MPDYDENDLAIRHARRLIESRQYVLESNWTDAQPTAEQENEYLDSHSWEEYSAWHLGLRDGAQYDTKERYGFIVGDFRRVHRSALMACVFRASQHHHKEVELAAHDLLQRLDQVSAGG
jgi:hypothetical protein